jgi:hypothetical protein
MKSKSRPKKGNKTSRKNHRTVAAPKTVEELAALWSKGINIPIVVDELAALWRVPVGNIYLRLHMKTLPIPVGRIGRYPRFMLGDAMGHLQQ